MNYDNKVIIIAGSPICDWNFLHNFITHQKKKVEILAVDKGLEICDQFKITPTCIIGDFDSVDPRILEKYSPELRVAYPSEKNLSDLELALEYVLSENYQDISIINATEGRLDHSLFNSLLLFKAPGKIKLHNSSGTLLALNPDEKYIFPMENNQIFSLIPLQECANLTIIGCKYPLHERDLILSTLTLSNVALQEVTIHFKSGRMLLFLEEVKKI